MRSVAGTAGLAKYLRATDSLGMVTAGKLADPVLLEANPLAEITNTQGIAAMKSPLAYPQAAKALLSKSKLRNKF